MRMIHMCLSLLLTASPLLAQSGAAIGLAAPAEIVESGLLGHLLPRFSLKTGIRVQPDPDGTLVLASEPPGVAVFADDRATYYLRGGDSGSNSDGAARFRDWLTSEIGRRTVAAFSPEGAPRFTPVTAAPAEPGVPVFDGNAARGEELSFAHCGRCHVIGPKNRMNGLGSTPSFAVLRTLPDWDMRFEGFFARNPHGAFTQIEGVTPPFDPARPPPIVPLRLKPGELEAILAYVSAIAPADLGAPLRHQ
ncbi:c-type cytochrome [Pukyongiella litopenaei]|uniref:Cytochrome c domain-containing protein n=1 Tax=Pukyongiella litopenaei TaxID=2605946 RepID=A0A2S0MKI2_9RHOB|nr:cytochrome c [Pukyongiella litopenaei]AVO36395.1 hypothetical protein C6Y53_00840 [Pukyongiella litopenaei]